MTIYVLALHGVTTGGPEATHQLSDALIDQGFDAKLVYFTWPDLKDGVPDEFPHYTGWAEEYAHYKVKLARALPDEDGAVIVLPETCCHLVPHWKRAKVLVWWLSVDNSVDALAACSEAALTAPNVGHVAQSQYAKGFIEDNGWSFNGMLSDYTPSLDSYAQPMAWGERPSLVAFNMRPDKVIPYQVELVAAAVRRAEPQAEFVAIAGMARQEVAVVLAAARVYVDIGTFPGKDRLPREAASMGCMPRVGNRGAGAWDFSEWALSEWPPCWPRDIVAAMRSPMAPRYNLFAERATFNTEVRNVFSQL